MKRCALALLAPLALLFPAAAWARGEFDPTTEFEQHEWVPIHLGTLDLSITKAVVYLMLGTVLTILLGHRPDALAGHLRQGRRPPPVDRRAIYEIAQVQVAEQGLPTKAIGRWFPYVATLMLFIWVVNMLGFIPLPLTGEKWHGVPTWGIYAATSLALGHARARAAHLRLHALRGHPLERPAQVLQELDPRGAEGAAVLIVPLEILGQFMRLISLSRPALREHARRATS